MIPRPVDIRFIKRRKAFLVIAKDVEGCYG